MVTRYTVDANDTDDDGEFVRYDDYVNLKRAHAQSIRALLINQGMLEDTIEELREEIKKK